MSSGDDYSENNLSSSSYFGSASRVRQASYDALITGGSDWSSSAWDGDLESSSTTSTTTMPTTTTLATTTSAETTSMTTTATTTITSMITTTTITTNDPDDWDSNPDWDYGIVTTSPTDSSTMITNVTTTQVTTTSNGISSGYNMLTFSAVCGTIVIFVIAIAVYVTIRIARSGQTSGQLDQTNPNVTQTTFIENDAVEGFTAPKRKRRKGRFWRTESPDEGIDMQPLVKPENEPVKVEPTDGPGTEPVVEPLVEPVVQPVVQQIVESIVEVNPDIPGNTSAQNPTNMPGQEDFAEITPADLTPINPANFTAITPANLTPINPANLTPLPPSK